jgi:hypothetical protein
MQRAGRPAWASLVLVLALAGCSSDGPKVPRSHSMASVALQGPTTAQIRQTALDVFKENLFQASYAGPENLVFEKPGSRMNDMAYGGWFDEPVWVRVKLVITRYGVESHLVACDAFIVRDRGSSVFEEEQRFYKISKGPYQKMLKEIKARLEKATPAKSPAPPNPPGQT